VEPEKEKVKW